MAKRAPRREDDTERKLDSNEQMTWIEEGGIDLRAARQSVGKVKVEQVANPKPAVKPKPKAKAKPKPKPKSKAKSKAKAKPKVRANPKARVKPKAKARKR